jgi:proteasome lid subunit RPN8/RPN11
MKPLEFAHGIWPALMADLHRRGDGWRESGAFLLRDATKTASSIQAWLPYDELDPKSLNYTYVRLESSAFSQLWTFCAEHKLEVVADVHTHPMGARQSPSDRAHPMISLAGHIALIVPRLARGNVRPSDLSFNIYLGGGKWVSYFHEDAASLIILREEHRYVC